MPDSALKTFSQKRCTPLLEKTLEWAQTTKHKGELERLADREPHCFVTTGEQNSGKSALLNRILNMPARNLEMGCIQEQFSCNRSNWLYSNTESSKFTRLQWTYCKWLSFVWRGLFLGWWGTNFIRHYIVNYPIGQPYDPFPLAYLTRWGELLCLVYAVVSFLVVGYDSMKKGDSTEASGFEKFSGFLAEMSTTMAVAITILYYALDTVTWSYSSIYAHLLNSVVMIIDLWLIAVPFKFYHFWASSVFSTCYIIVNVSIWAATSRVLYSAMDWGNKTGLAAGVSVGVILAGIPILHGLMTAISCLREFLGRKCCGESKRAVITRRRNSSFEL